jgi:uncharacterized protein (TIGR03435 family)
MHTTSPLRNAACLALVGLLAASAAFGQTTPATPPPIAFEVASVKPSPPLDPAKLMSGQLHMGMSINAARVDFGYTPLMGLIAAAYKVKPTQVSGPSWLNTTMFDIVAKLPEGATKDQVPEMLQSLLADRFKMAMHRENKEQSEFTLVVGKGGPKLKAAEPEPETTSDSAAAKPGEMTIDGPDGPTHMTVGKDGTMQIRGPGTSMTAGMKNGMMHMEAAKITMKAFAQMIAQFAGRPVVDKTELTGSYQLTLDFSMEELIAMARANGMMGAMGGAAGPAPAPGQGPANAAADPSGPSIFAVVQQYGLKLVSQKVSEELIVIDHIEKTPTEN